MWLGMWHIVLSCRISKLRYYLAYMGELSDLGKDFLTYILGAGQTQVENYCILWLH